MDILFCSWLQAWNSWWGWLVTQWWYWVLAPRWQAKNHWPVCIIFLPCSPHPVKSPPMNSEVRSIDRELALCVSRSASLYYIAVLREYLIIGWVVALKRNNYATLICFDNVGNSSGKRIFSNWRRVSILRLKKSRTCISAAISFHSALFTVCTHLYTPGVCPPIVLDLIDAKSKLWCKLHSS